MDRSRRPNTLPGHSGTPEHPARPQIPATLIARALRRLRLGRRNAPTAGDPVATRLWVRHARGPERRALEALQRRASLQHPADRAALLEDPDAIELPQQQVDLGLVRVIEDAGARAGFAVLLGPTAGACELDGLFVDPDRMGAGLGRLLVEDAVRIARERGATSIEVTANPRAIAFYQRVGFTATQAVVTRFGPATRMRLDVHGPG